MSRVRGVQDDRVRRRRYPVRRFELLAILVRNRDKVVTYAALDRALGTNRAIDERNPWRVSISKIRKQLGVGPQRPVVHTELRVGYRLIVPDDAP